MSANTSTGFLVNHRGPYKFLITRTTVKDGQMIGQSEWLRGIVDSDHVEDEARALLTDPRDTIRDVCVWSVREQQFAGVIRREEK